MEKDVMYLLAVGMLVLLAWLLIPTWMIKRNIREVVHIFQKKNAIGIQNAKTIEELGLKPKSMLQRILRGRDWKPQALDLLVQTNVVLMREDGKLYITEGSLASATWLKLKK